MTSLFDPTAVNPVSDTAQAAYATILADPKNASNAGVQMLQQFLPASAFKVLGAQLFAGVNGVTARYPEYRPDEIQPRVGFAYKLGPTP